MSEKINFTYQNKDYCLEFTRKSIEIMERNGFTIDGVKDKPVTTISTLFSGAFLAHHRSTKRELIDEIYSKLPNKSELLSTLIEMYNEPVAALVDEPESDKGNVMWTTGN